MLDVVVMPKKDKGLGIRVSEDVKKKVVDYAARTNRSESAMAEQMLKIAAVVMDALPGIDDPNIIREAAEKYEVSIQIRDRHLTTGTDKGKKDKEHEEAGDPPRNRVGSHGSA